MTKGVNMAVPVYFADARSKSPKTSRVAKLERLLDRLNLDKMLAPGELAAIKLHFGELGNDAFVSPVFARAVSDAIRKAGAKPFFADTNTLYTGSRANAVDHYETAIRHGFDYAVINAPILIADGLRSGNFREVFVGQKWFESVKIAGDFAEADAIIALSHFKGHNLAGFGGAIKNLAMGCAPMAGKKDQHSVRFSVRAKDCVGCLACAAVCPAKAIEPHEGKAFIDKATCIGCGECSVRCPVKAIYMDWDVDVTEFTEKLVEYAYGAVKDKKGKAAYITFVTAVVPDCDCTPWADLPVVPDIGILASADPVAIDQAAFDLVKAAPVASGSSLEGLAGPGEDKFGPLHPGLRGEVQLEHGEAIGLGSRKYELITI
jgi:uncharacterized Fe-S center protein